MENNYTSEGNDIDSSKSPLLNPITTTFPETSFLRRYVVNSDIRREVLREAEAAAAVNNFARGRRMGEGKPTMSMNPKFKGVESVVADSKIAKFMFKTLKGINSRVSDRMELEKAGALYDLAFKYEFMAKTIKWRYIFESILLWISDKDTVTQNEEDSLSSETFSNLCNRLIQNMDNVWNQLRVRVANGLILNEKISAKIKNFMFDAQKEEADHNILEFISKLYQQPKRANFSEKISALFSETMDNPIEKANERLKELAGNDVFDKFWREVAIDPDQLQLNGEFEKGVADYIKFVARELNKEKMLGGAVEEGYGDINKFMDETIRKRAHVLANAISKNNNGYTLDEYSVQVYKIADAEKRIEEDVTHDYLPSNWYKYVDEDYGTPRKRRYEDDDTIIKRNQEMKRAMGADVMYMRDIGSEELLQEFCEDFFNTHGIQYVPFFESAMLRINAYTRIPVSGVDVPVTKFMKKNAKRELTAQGDYETVLGIFVGLFNALPDECKEIFGIEDSDTIDDRDIILKKVKNIRGLE